MFLEWVILKHGFQTSLYSASSLSSIFPSPETSKVDYVLFQAATAIMESVVREWILLEKTSIESLRAFLLTYVLQRPK